MSRHILSLDGGGIRGMATVQILRYVQSRLAELSCDLSSFDLLCGNSTGAIIALALSRPGYTMLQSLEELEELYAHFDRVCTTAGEQHSSRYTAEGLINAGNKLFGDLRLQDATLPVCACAFNMTKGMPVLLSSESHPEMLFSQAMHCSCSAPGFFPPVDVPQEEGLLVDGGVFANNPILFAYKHAKVLYGQPVAALSISTAWLPHRGSSLESCPEESKLLATGQMRTADLIAESIPDLQYYRVHEFLGESQITLDAASALDILKGYGIQIAAVHQKEIEEFARSMIGRGDA